MMTQDQKNKIATVLAYMCEYYSKSLSKPAIQMMVEDLADLDFQQVYDAFGTYRKDPRNSQFPLPAKIREVINPAIDKRNVAVELAYRIDKAISKHGYNWVDGYYSEKGNYWNDNKGNTFSTFKEAVISELGEIGWHAICSRGGWSRVSSSANEMQEGQFISQMRDQIQATITLKEQGVDVARIGMPSAGSSLQIEQGLQSSKDVLSLISSKSEEKNEDVGRS